MDHITRRTTNFRLLKIQSGDPIKPNKNVRTQKLMSRFQNQLPGIDIKSEVQVYESAIIPEDVAINDFLRLRLI